MRTALQARDGERLPFTATVERFGKRRGWRGEEETILLKNVRFETGALAADHLWWPAGDGTTGLQSGDHLPFTARVNASVKGYRGRNEFRQADTPLELDYRLARPTQVRLIASPPSSPGADNAGASAFSGGVSVFTGARPCRSGRIGPPFFFRIG